VSRLVRVHARGPRRSVDPTHTATLRERFMRDVARRYDRIAKAILQLIVEDDVFGLEPIEFERVGNVLRVNRPRREFAFGTTHEKVAAFMEWLRQQEINEAITIVEGTPIERAARSAWTSVYVESAYQKGIADAGRNLRGAGAKVERSWIDTAFNRPIHADRLGIAYTRTFEELVGITAEMDRQISAVLAQGLAEGRGPMDIARRLIDRVEKIGKTRARTLARTEVINAHAEATLNAYEEAGVEGVEVESEFATAGDAQVCPECRQLEGRTFTLARARGVIPVHPNCRCAWVPAIVRGENVVLNAAPRFRRIA